MSILTARLVAFERQGGFCCYCALPMWRDSVLEFAKEHRISVARALMHRCTAEHLTPKSAGGAASIENIAAACSWCNRKRHARPVPLEPIAYFELVQARLCAGRWFPGG